MRNKILGTALLCTLFLSSCTIFETPEIREPKEMQVRILGFDSCFATIRIESHCYNQNRIGFTFKGGELDLMLNEHTIGHAVIDTTFKVAGRSNFMVPIQLKFDANKLGQTNLDFTKNVTVTVDGNMRGTAFGVNRTLPIHYVNQHMINLILPYAL